MADAATQGTPAAGDTAATASAQQGVDNTKVSGDPIAAAAADKAATAADAGKEGDAKAADAKTADAKAAEGTKEGDAKPADKKDGEGDKKEGEGPKGEFKAEDFTLPEGFKMNDGLLTEFNGVLSTDGVIKEGKLTPEGAQAFINLHAKALQDALGNTEVREGIFKQEAEKRLNAWAEKSVKEGYTQEQLATAMAGIEGLKIPELTDMVKDVELGFGSHPKLIGMFLKVGQRMKEAGFGSGNALGGSKKEAHDVLFGETK